VLTCWIWTFCASFANSEPLWPGMPGASATGCGFLKAGEIVGKPLQNWVFQPVRPTRLKSSFLDGLILKSTQASDPNEIEPCAV
jgi:hypothetical protein